MTGPYLIGIDCGTQSAKVVVVRRRRATSVAEGRQSLRPMSRPQPRRRVPSRTTTSGTRSPRRADAPWRSSTGNPSEIAAVGLCTIRCCKAFLDADGSLVEPVISWMDDRAYQPYLPDDPSLGYATTSSGYLGHRFTGELRDSAANNILLQWPIDTDTWQWSDDAALLRALRRAAGACCFELQLPGEVIGTITAGRRGRDGHPGRDSGRPDRERQGGRGARRRAARRDDRARLARHLHRGDGARAREPQGAAVLLDELRLRARTATSTRATASAAGCGR